MKRLRTQEGAVLVTGLLMLILTAMMGVFGLSSSILEMKMSVNEEERINALQTAQAALDEITDDPGNFVVFGTPGDTLVNCTSGLKCDNGDLSYLTLSNKALSDKSQHLNVAITRSYPEEATPPRLRGAEFSTRQFRATFFQAESEHQELNTAGGVKNRATLFQGLMLLIPNVNNGVGRSSFAAADTDDAS